METFAIKRGDTRPVLRYALSPATVDLNGATVVFNLRGRVVRGAAAVASTEPPEVEYVWQAGDTAMPGVAPAEFEITYADGGVATFPARGALVVTISEDLG